MNVGTALDHLWSHLSYFLVNIGRNICTSERSGQAVCSLDSGFLAKLLLLVLRRSVDRAADTSDYFRGIPFNRDWTAQISLQLIVRDISWVAIWHYYHSITCMELQTTKLPIGVHMPEEHGYKYMTCTVYYEVPRICTGSILHALVGNSLKCTLFKNYLAKHMFALLLLF